MKVQLTQPWRAHEAGEVVDVSDLTASGLMTAGAAVPAPSPPPKPKTKAKAKNTDAVDDAAEE